VKLPARAMNKLRGRTQAGATLVRTSGRTETINVRFGSEADMRCKTSCPLYPRKRTCAAQRGMSAMGHKRTLHAIRSPRRRTDRHSSCFIGGPRNMPALPKHRVKFGWRAASPTTQAWHVSSGLLQPPRLLLVCGLSA